MVAPEHLRATLRGLSLIKQLARIEATTTTTTATVEHRVTVLTLQSITARIRFPPVNSTTSILSWVGCCANILLGRRCLRNRASALSWLLDCCSVGPTRSGSATRHVCLARRRCSARGQ